MSDREKMIEVIESFANGVDFIEVIQCGALADRLIKAGFRIVDKEPVKCFGCGGDGKIRNHGGKTLWKKCDRCNGTGKQQ